MQIISEHRKIKKDKPIKKGFKRVMAIVEMNGRKVTRHMDIPQ